MQSQDLEFGHQSDLFNPDLRLVPLVLTCFFPPQPYPATLNQTISQPLGFYRVSHESRSLFFTFSRILPCIRACGETRGLCNPRNRVSAR